MNKNVTYTTEGIVITIPSASPGATHENLLRGTLAGIRGHLHDDDKRPQDTAKLIPRVAFLERLLPSEQKQNQSFGKNNLKKFKKTAAKNRRFFISFV